MGSKKFNSFETGKKAAEEVLNSVSVRACVDQYVQDQLIIFMALAKEKSVIKTSPITLHTTTAIFIAEVFTEVSFLIFFFTLGIWLASIEIVYNFKFEIKGTKETTDLERLLRNLILKVGIKIDGFSVKN